MKGFSKPHLHVWSLISSLGGNPGHCLTSFRSRHCLPVVLDFCPHLTLLAAISAILSLRILPPLSSFSLSSPKIPEHCYGENHADKYKFTLSNFNLALAAARQPFYLSHTFPGTLPHRLFQTLLLLLKLQIPVSLPSTSKNFVWYLIKLTVPLAINK